MTFWKLNWFRFRRRSSRRSRTFHNLSTDKTTGPCCNPRLRRYITQRFCEKSVASREVRLLLRYSNVTLRFACQTLSRFSSLTIVFFYWINFFFNVYLFWISNYKANNLSPSVLLNILTTVHPNDFMFCRGLLRTQHVHYQYIFNNQWNGTLYSHKGRTSRLNWPRNRSPHTIFRALSFSKMHPEGRGARREVACWRSHEWGCRSLSTSERSMTHSWKIQTTDGSRTLSAPPLSLTHVTECPLTKS